ncbi:10363_t:CDS:2 [Paraglomus brasilianum]|uniref:10363_t:CDS:1 n=1 Tax=Paraglomus brasilianum TaxID=144538 RepID=A0A9N9GFJ2_9GLOM|nr:10363_t:CDS:2 [Paraglomus brasilianum]
MRLPLFYPYVSSLPRRGINIYPYVPVFAQKRALPWPAARAKRIRRTITELRGFYPQRGVLRKNEEPRVKQFFKTVFKVLAKLAERLQMDLVDLLSFAEHNDGYSYILTMIDVFSRYVWVIPLKDKEGSTINKKLARHGLLYMCMMFYSEFDEFQVRGSVVITNYFEHQRRETFLHRQTSKNNAF